MTISAPILVLALLSAADVPAPSAPPAPEGSPLREIGTVSASASCETLVKLAVPVAVIAGRDDREFLSLDTHVEKFISGKGTGDGGTEHDALASSHAGTVGPADPKTFDPNDDEDTYSPEREMSAANIDRVVGEIQHNLDAADKVMSESWKEHPGTNDPAINALRQRVQNIIDLQRALAFRLDYAAGLYFSNSGVASLSPSGERANFKTLLDQIIDSAIQSDRIAQSALRLPPSLSPPDGKPIADVNELKTADAGSVALALRVQESSLVAEANRLARKCDGP